MSVDRNRSAAHGPGVAPLLGGPGPARVLALAEPDAEERQVAFRGRTTIEGSFVFIEEPEFHWRRDNGTHGWDASGEDVLALPERRVLSVEFGSGWEATR